MDGDIDVVGAASNDNKIAWYENDGSENFTKSTVDFTNAQAVYAADIDGDGAMDVLGGSNGELAWFESSLVAGPTISSVSLNAANSELTVTFSENVYNTNGGSGDLEVADFALSISGGAAGVNATPASITKTAQNIWVLGLTLTGGTANGSETLTVVPAAGTAIYNAAGNAASTSQSNNTASLTEKIAPTVTAVTSTTGNGTYKQGQTIAITIGFSEVVNVTGLPQLTLETSQFGVDAVVNYSSGTGSNTLTFNYTIGSGETSSDLDYVATSSLALYNGGGYSSTIKDAAGNDATLTLASPGASNSLGDNKAIDSGC